MLNRTRKTLNNIRSIARESPALGNSLAAGISFLGSYFLGDPDNSLPHALTTTAGNVLVFDAAQYVIASSPKELIDTTKRVISDVHGLGKIVLTSINNALGRHDQAIFHAKQKGLPILGEFAQAEILAEQGDLSLAISHYAKAFKHLKKHNEKRRRKGIIATIGNAIEEQLEYAPIKTTAERRAASIGSYTSGRLLNLAMCASATKGIIATELAERTLTELYRRTSAPQEALLRAAIAEALQKEEAHDLWKDAIKHLEGDKMLKGTHVQRHKFGSTHYVVKEGSYEDISTQEENILATREALEETPHSAPRPLARIISKDGSKSKLLLEYVDGPTLHTLDENSTLTQGHILAATGLIALLHQKLKPANKKHTYSQYLQEKAKDHKAIPELMEHYGIIDQLLHMPQYLSLDAHGNNFIIPSEGGVSIVELETRGAAALTLDLSLLYGGLRRPPLSPKDIAEHYVQEHSERNLDPNEILLGLLLGNIHLGFVYGTRTVEAIKEPELSENYQKNGILAFDQLKKELPSYAQRNQTALNGLETILKSLAA